MANLGFIGLGNIGGAIARNLVADGHTLVVSDLERARVEELVKAGASAATGPADVARRSDVTFLSLPTPDSVDAVAADWLAGAARGKVLVDLSTNSPARVRALAKRVEAAGAHLLDAPLTGGAIGARNRMLMFMVGGDAAVYERVRPIFEKIGRATFHMGDQGLGMTAKLVNSCIAFSATCASLEALALGSKAGIDLRHLVQMLRTGGAGNFYIQMGVEAIEKRGSPTEFALELAAKDAGLMLELGRALGVPTPVTAQVAQVLVSAVGAGMGDKDWSELPALLERQAAHRFQLAPDPEKK
jgi:3-hydroxyisobutyrate dehydrogenase-like beta-hydroxyacid dehydrogenase